MCCILLLITYYQYRIKTDELGGLPAYGTRAPQTARGKISLARVTHCFPNFLNLFLPSQRLYIVKNI